MSHPTIPDQIRAAAAGPTPVAPEHMHSWLGQDALLAILERHTSEQMADLQMRFAARGTPEHSLRRKMLLDLADALDVYRHQELLRAANLLERLVAASALKLSVDDAICMNRGIACLRARAGGIE